MIYGYARISTRSQKIERQRDNIIERYPDAIMVEEAFTGRTIDRPQWNRLYNKVVAGDTIVFDEVSRMSRNAEEGYRTYRALFDRGVQLVFLKEPHINSSVFRDSISQSLDLTGNEIADEYIKATNRVMMILAEKQVHLAFEQAQKEVDYLSKRTSEGIMKVKKENDRIRLGLSEGSLKQIGQTPGRKLKTKKSVDAKKIIIKYSKDFGGHYDDDAVMHKAGISRNTYYKYKRELREAEVSCALSE